LGKLRGFLAAILPCVGTTKLNIAGAVLLFYLSCVPPAVRAQRNRVGFALCDKRRLVL